VLIDLFVQRYIDAKLDYIAGLDARGFIFGPILAHELSIGFIPIRKAGKLPYKRISQSYELEYGTATVEIHEDACEPGDRVVIIDDLIATGGTMMAGKMLLERLGAVVVEGAAIVDLPELGGSKLLGEGGLALYTVTSFDGH
jgi:adenine phosphoribosyltransferase